MQRGRRMLALVLLVLAVAMVAGCSAVAEKATETAVQKATGVKVDTAGDAGGEAKLPADFPADVPIYENAKIQTVMSNDVAGGKNYLVALKSDDDAAKVHAWYKTALEDKGWKITNSMEVGDSVGGLNAEKDALKLNLAIGYGAEKKADISLTLTPKK